MLQTSALVCKLWKHYRSACAPERAMGRVLQLMPDWARPCRVFALGQVVLDSC